MSEASEPQREPRGPAGAAGPRTLGLAVALAALTLAVYAPVLDHAFVAYDDDLYITNAEPLRDGLGWEGLRWALTSTEGANWFPLTRLSWLVDAELFGVEPAGFHATNAVLHALAAALLLVALARLTGAPVHSAAVAAVFALHPLHVESVAWAAARKDVLSGVFAAATLLAYEGAARRGGRGRHARVALWLALGLMAKPTLVVWPFVLLLLDVWPLRRVGDRGDLLRAVREKGVLFGLAAASALVTLATQAGDATVRSLEEVPLGARLPNALASYWHYTADAFWPRGLAVFHPHPGRDAPSGAAWLGAALLVAGTLGALRGARRRPALAVGWLWWVGALVPVIGLVQVGQAARADRYTYLPLIGLAIAVVWGASALCGRRRTGRRLAAVGAAAALVALSAATRAQLATWRDSESLFEHALRVTERNHVAHVNLGLVRLREQRLDEASAHLVAALRIAPASAIGAGLLGHVRMEQGREEEAIRLYRRALRLDPAAERWRRALARALVARGRTAEAARVLRAGEAQAERSER